MHVDFKTRGREVLDYSVVLLAEIDGQMEAVRLYDGSHNQNELHRYTSVGGKQTAEIVHDGTLGEGMRAAIKEIEGGYEAMIESWRKR